MNVRTRYDQVRNEYDWTKVAVVVGGGSALAFFGFSMLNNKRRLLKTTAALSKMDLAARKVTEKQWAESMRRDNLWWKTYETALDAHNAAVEAAEKALNSS